MSKRIAKKQAIIQAAIEVFGKGRLRDSAISEIAGKAHFTEGVPLF
jgi:hypothetical protein